MTEAYFDPSPSFSASLVGVEPAFVTEIVLSISDPVLEQAPSALTVILVEGVPDDVVSFSVDGGDPVYTLDLDSEGEAGPVSIPIPATVTSGAHVLIVTTSDGHTSQASFTVTEDPDPSAYTVPQDAPPAFVPEAITPTGVHRWVLQDLAPGGLGSFVFPANPVSTAPWPFRRSVEQKQTLGLEGKFHLTDPVAEVMPWSFAGRYQTLDFQQQLLAYAALNRRLWLIDHRNRAWVIAILGVDLVPSRRRLDHDGLANDQIGDYTVRVLLYDRDPKVPM